jgi:hypothetical protein
MLHKQGLLPGKLIHLPNVFSHGFMLPGVGDRLPPNGFSVYFLRNIFHNLPQAPLHRK